jgi:3-oxoacyl-[acyl-carrier protein] reductase
VGPHGITVNAIGPGGILTDMNTDVYPDEDAKRRRTQELPLRRFGSVEDVASCALFLAAPSGDYVTGQMLSPNGGGAM